MHPGALVRKMETLQQMSQLHPQQQQQQQQAQPTSDISISTSASFVPSDHNIVSRHIARTPFPFRRMRKLKLKNSPRMCLMPETSLHEYARWIETKGLEERSEQEQKFLFKYQKRRLIQQDKLSTETLRNYVDRLLRKDDRTEAENRLIRQYHRRARRKMKLEGKQGDTQNVMWMRNRPNKAVVQANTNNPALMAQMAALKESMGKMGLSAQKLRDIKMD